MWNLIFNSFGCCYNRSSKKVLFINVVTAANSHSQSHLILMQPWILAYCCVLGFVEVHPQLLYLLDWGYVGFTPTWMLSLHAESQLLSCVFFISLHYTYCTIPFFSTCHTKSEFHAEMYDFPFIDGICNFEQRKKTLIRAWFHKTCKQLIFSKHRKIGYQPKLHKVNIVATGAPLSLAVFSA